MTILEERTGNIFDASANSILIHACNAEGAWGSGVAFEFKKRYPAAYKVYNTHCKPHLRGKTAAEHQGSLVGTALLIPPSSPSKRPTRASSLSSAPAKEYWIACLFTSKGYGRNVDPPSAIARHTKKSLQDLKIKVDMLKGENIPTNLVTVRINSGLFAVPWDETRNILEDAQLRFTVVSPPVGVNEIISKGGLGGATESDGMKKGINKRSKSQNALDATVKRARNGIGGKEPILERSSSRRKAVEGERAGDNVP